MLSVNLILLQRAMIWMKARVQLRTAGGQNVYACVYLDASSAGHANDVTPAVQLADKAGALYNLSVACSKVAGIGSWPLR